MWKVRISRVVFSPTAPKTPMTIVKVNSKTKIHSQRASPS